MNYFRKAAGNHIAIDLGVAANFFLTVKARRTSGEISCKFGPFEEYCRFVAVLDRTELGGCTYYRSRKLISARWLEISFSGMTEEDVSVNVEPEMREERDLSNFRCSDKLLENIFRVSADTLRACVVKHFRGNSSFEIMPPDRQNFALNWHGDSTDYVITDAPRRDREVWVGDLLPEIRTVISLFNDSEIVENSLGVILEQMTDDGFIPASSVSFQVFYEYNCWFLIVLYEYMLLTGNEDFFRKNIQKIEKVLTFIEGLLENDSLKLDTFNTWAYSLDRKGFITSTQCVLFRAFELAGKMFADVNEGKAEHYRQMAGRVKTQIMSRGFDRESGWFYDVLDCEEKRYSLDANALAVMFGVCEDGQANRVLDNMKKNLWTEFGSRVQYPKERKSLINHIHTDNIWPFGVTFEVEARFMRGDFEGALELIRRTWGIMLDNGATTFWEAINMETGGFETPRFLPREDDLDTWNSACHGWSAGLPHLINTYILGVKPETYGYQRCSFAPYLAKIEAIFGRIPTKYGMIEIDIRREESGHRIRLDIPEGIEPFYDGNGSLFAADGEIVKKGCVLASGVYRLKCPTDECMGDIA